MASATQRTIRLSKREDWEAWLSIIKHKATAMEVWGLVDPDILEKPENKIRPTRPDIATVRRLTDATQRQIAMENLKLDEKSYRLDLQEYERERKHLTDLTETIMNTLDADNTVYVRQTESHPWNLLRSLRQRLAPSSNARSLTIEKEYHRLSKGPSNNQDVSKWVDDWVLMIAHANEIHLAESQGTRPVRDFLLAVQKRYPEFANTYMMQLELGMNMSHDVTVDHFRRHHEFSTAQNRRNVSHSAFQSTTQQANRASFRGQQQPQECLCGETHWWADCHYLNPAQRPLNWAPNAECETRVAECLKNNGLRKKVQSSIER